MGQRIENTDFDLIENGIHNASYFWSAEVCASSSMANAEEIFLISKSIIIRWMVFGLHSVSLDGSCVQIRMKAFFNCYIFHSKWFGGVDLGSAMIQCPALQSKVLPPFSRCLFVRARQYPKVCHAQTRLPISEITNISLIHLCCLAFHEFFLRLVHHCRYPDPHYGWLAICLGKWNFTSWTWGRLVFAGLPWYSLAPGQWWFCGRS